MGWRGGRGLPQGAGPYLTCSAGRVPGGRAGGGGLGLRRGGVLGVTQPGAVGAVGRTGREGAGELPFVGEISRAGDEPAGVDLNGLYQWANRYLLWGVCLLYAFWSGRYG